MEKNQNLNMFSFIKGKKLNIDFPLIFNIGKIDDYINSYDLLPTYNTPLVSNRFKNIFGELNDELQYFNAKIIDKKGNQNENFYLINIINILPVMDKEKSIFEYDGDGDIDNIKKLFLINGGLKGHSIIRMKEHTSYIIVSEEFKNCCVKEKLKGINFMEEGYSIYKME
jgi:hypothetical protein